MKHTGELFSLHCQQERFIAYTYNAAGVGMGPVFEVSLTKINLGSPFSLSAGSYGKFNDSISQTL